MSRKVLNIDQFYGILKSFTSTLIKDKLTVLGGFNNQFHESCFGILKHDNISSWDIRG